MRFYCHMFWFVTISQNAKVLFLLHVMICCYYPFMTYWSFLSQINFTSDSLSIMCTCCYCCAFVEIGWMFGIWIKKCGSEATGFDVRSLLLCRLTTSLWRYVSRSRCFWPLSVHVSKRFCFDSELICSILFLLQSEKMLRNLRWEFSCIFM